MSHSLGYDVNCSILMTELEMLDRPAAVKDLGFDAVEFWWPFTEAVPSDIDVSRFVTAIEDAGVALVGLNFFAGDMPGGDRGIVSAPGRTSEFRDNVDVVVGIAEHLGTRSFNALYGNRLVDMDPVEQDEVALANLTFAAEAVARIGGTVLLEPVSGADQYPLLTAQSVVAVIDEVRAGGGPENLALLADFYHLAVNGDDVDRVIREVAPRIGHVQIADVPGRNQPGTGSLPIDRQLTDLEAQGYAGWVGLEYHPTRNSRDSFDWIDRERRGKVAL